MGKELKSCTAIQAILRKRVGWPCPEGQPSKGHLCRILILFPKCSATLLAPHIKKLETYFALLYFWTFEKCENDCYVYLPTVNKQRRFGRLVKSLHFFLKE
jgi:hypothetical protein